MLEQATRFRSASALTTRAAQHAQERRPLDRASEYAAAEWGADERALVACTLWLQVSFIGMSILAAGLIEAMADEPSLPKALTLVTAGPLLVAIGWWRGRAVLVRAERAAASRDQAPRTSERDRFTPR